MDLAVKWARHGLTVYAIAPGIMNEEVNIQFIIIRKLQEDR
nr:hypothetical protein [Priestia megaterium]